MVMVYESLIRLVLAFSLFTLSLQLVLIVLKLVRKCLVFIFIIKTFVYSTIYLIIYGQLLIQFQLLSFGLFFIFFFILILSVGLITIILFFVFLQSPSRGSGEGVFVVFVIFLLLFCLLPLGWAEILNQSISYKCIVRVSFLNFI